MPPPLASIVITTRNRRDETLRAIGSCYAQSYRPLEVLVFDDASDDGTPAAVRALFPEARVFENGERRGYIVHRNRGLQEAGGSYVFSLDDDAFYSAPGIVADVCAIMEGSADIAAVAIPYAEPLNRRSPSVRRARRLPRRGEEVRSFVGCAHALRRGVALGLGGYREFFVHQGEERDLCIRMRDKGFRIVYADCERIVHTVSPSRDRGRMVFYGTRNTLLFDFLNAPASVVAGRLCKDVVGLTLYRLSPSTLGLKVRAAADAVLTAWRHRDQRRPVSRATWRMYRHLPAHGPEDP